jgi:hypothetical protein
VHPELHERNFAGEAQTKEYGESGIGADLNGCACKSGCSIAVQERELTNDTSLQGCIREKHCNV